ncbi:Pkinase-domain-containing protein [Fomitiporia mediterranea MF3/22]|uniref:Pkinase-domain-containing protein n=1 Tax=Fomitiporia mediterranea (strain MF3/22) TaxID=694068 RepID=UPI0004408C92|nr:Pkinase-domain-containing protein [Fomitiporia mediterranea MF3/22]EJD00335.1 Pkinase-domain-containing protein [Fomitiporia mediterranea MF3/22]
MSVNAQRHSYALNSPPPLVNLTPFEVKSHKAPKHHDRWKDPIPYLTPCRKLGQWSFWPCMGVYIILTLLIPEVTRPDIKDGNGEEVKFAAKITKKPEIQDKESQKLAEEDEIWVNSEALIMRELRHPNVLEFYGVFVNDYAWVIICEYAKGGDLEERIKSRGPFREKEAKHYAWQLVKAVAHFDSHHTLHRDLKPSNLLIRTYNTPSRSSDSSSSSSSSDEKVKEAVVVGDFGNARRNEKRKAHKLCGTLRYLAPEQSKGEYTTKVDMWSVGSIVSELLTKSNTYDAIGYHRVLKAKQSKDNTEDFEIVMTNAMIDRIFNTNIWRFISNDAKSFVRRCLEVDPERRMSAHEALEHPWISEYKRNAVEKTEIPIRTKQSQRKNSISAKHGTPRSSQRSEDLEGRKTAAGSALSQHQKVNASTDTKDARKGGRRHGTK